MINNVDEDFQRAIWAGLESAAKEAGVNVDPGGTSMDQGIALGLAEVEKGQADNRLSQVVVLTDGETSSKCYAPPTHRLQSYKNPLAHVRA